MGHGFTKDAVGNKKHLYFARFPQVTHFICLNFFLSYNSGIVIYPAYVTTLNIPPTYCMESKCTSCFRSCSLMLLCIFYYFVEWL